MRATAFLATRPAITITPGLEVLVQEVIAAMTTSPCVTGASGATVRAGVAAAVAAMP